jgi:hypothetical protein
LSQSLLSFGFARFGLGFEHPDLGSPSFKFLQGDGRGVGEFIRDSDSRRFGFASQFSSINHPLGHLFPFTERAFGAGRGKQPV